MLRVKTFDPVNSRFDQFRQNFFGARQSRMRNHCQAARLMDQGKRLPRGDRLLRVPRLAVVARAMLADATEGARAIVSSGADRPSGVAAFLNIIPTNIFTAAADNDILAIMFFALVFGIGLLLVDTPASNQLQGAIEGIFHVAMRLIGIVIRLAPLAIACFMFNLAAVFGWDLLVRLGAYVGVVLLALGLAAGTVVAVMTLR